MKRIQLAVVTAIMLLAPMASAYVMILDNQGNALVWPKNTINWSLAGDGTPDTPFNVVEGALKSAFASWQNVGCSAIKFTYDGPVSAPPSTGIFIRWLNGTWDTSVQDAAGVTRNWEFGFDGPKKVEIHFNGVSFTWVTSGADDPFSDTTDIEAVAAHEIGHAIGLDHPRHRDSTMFFSLFPGQSEDQRSLEPDDERGACFLYPSGSFSAGQPCDFCSQHSNCAQGLCLNFGAAEGQYCGKDCTGANCPEGFTCYELQGTGSPQCLPDNDHCSPTGANIQVGSTCYDHATCASGRCLVLPESAICTQDCNPQSNGGCPADMACVGKGTQGICYPKGTAELGEICLSPADCSSFDCIGIGGNQGVCTQPCESDTQCPASFKCVVDFCIKAGAKAFGEPCLQLTECQSGFCAGTYCSEFCDTDLDCPGGLECLPNGICTKGATGQTGDICGINAETCVEGLFCFYESEGANQGTCATNCDARYDKCGSGEYCDWVWQDWTKKVIGVCVGDNGGASVGQDCGGSAFCKPDLVCADTDGTGAKCRQDCNANNTLGCTGGASCIPLNLETDPKLGACHPKDAPPATEAPSVVETTRTAEPPPTMDDDLGSDTTGGGTTGGTTEAGTEGGGAEGGGAATTGGVTPRETGGCSTAGAPGPGGAAGVLLLLALAVLTRRRKAI